MIPELLVNLVGDRSDGLKGLNKTEGARKDGERCTIVSAGARMVGTLLQVRATAIDAERNSVPFQTTLLDRHARSRTKIGMFW